MKWSWKIGELAGIGVYVHATFLILIGWVGLVHWKAEQSVEAVAGGVGFILALFGCVVLHELGHALVARRYGIRTRDITLLPIGGVARLERIPEEPRQELAVALAGPAVNVAIAVALGLFHVLLHGPVPLGHLGVATGPFLERLLIVNVFLALFNLLPAFPMDGGRVLRAFLATRMVYTRATQIAAGVGQAMAFVFGFLGLFTNPFLLFIAFFVWLGASQEAAMVQMRSSLGGIPVSRAMLTDFEALAPGDRLARAVELTLAGAQKDFPVLDGTGVVGVLRHGDLLAGISRLGPGARVAEAMRTDIEPLHPHEMLKTAFERLQNCDCRTMPVLHNGRLVGLLTLDNLGEFMLIQGALGRNPRRSS
ncbi:MAG: site-2 protease family protein [Thermoanaerobaculia bacterium]